MKIHETRMSHDTKRRLYHQLHSHVLCWTDHALARMKEKDLTVDDVMLAVGGKIVEWHDDCLLLRSEGGVCAVVNLETGYIVTAYRNNQYDEHSTLDTSQYLFGAS